VNVLFVGSELAPYAKTGGLADVMAALPRHLARAGHDVRVVVPLYDKIDPSKVVFEGTPVASGLTIPLGGYHYNVDILRAAGTTPRVYFVRCPALYARGSIYTSDDDEHRRYLALCMAALFTCERLGFAPDVVHANDWQAALLPLLMRTRAAGDRLFARTRTLLTIHNLNYQGMFPSSAVADTGIPRHLFHQDQLRAGRVNFLLHGIMYADGVNTVSPTYAAEIQTPEHGAGLDFYLRARSSTVVGILNGVDYDEWSPERDRHIPHAFSAGDLAGKTQCKEALLEQLSLPYLPHVPVIGIVSRLAGQKGFNLVGEVMPDLLRRHGFQLVVLGSGDPGLQELFAGLQTAFPRQVCFFRGFSEPLAHLIEAGSDMFLMPSRYEPCGLNQMYSLRYGTVPIVHKTGGLADTVTPWDPHSGEGTGFRFEHHDGAGLRWAVETALAAYRDARGWRRLMLNGMAEDFSWDKQRKLYELVYARLHKETA
jgi:starch synthase